MALKDAFVKMAERLSEQFIIPHITDLFLPVFTKGGQPRDAEFMAMKLASGAVGVSYVLLPNEELNEYESLKSHDFSGKNPADYAFDFGHLDPIKNMLSLAAVNAICQHIMKTTNYPLDVAADSLGHLDIQRKDRVGMVGFLSP